jgi:hypothetical protein
MKKRKNYRWEIAELGDLKGRFEKKSSRTKSRMLKSLINSEILNAEHLAEYHDILCFIRAYPDNREILETVEKELKSFSGRIDSYREKTRDREAAQLSDTGITGTSLSHEFSFALAESLAKWYPKLTEIDWERYDEKNGDPISSMLSILVAWQENDALDNDLEISTEQWLNYSCGRSDRSALAAFMKLLKSSAISDIAVRNLYDSAEIPIKWELKNCRASRTLKRVYAGRVFYQHEDFIGRTRDLRSALRSAPNSLKRLPQKQGEQYIRHIKEILGVRCRELYPLINAEPREVYISEPGRGIQIAVYGDKIDVRMPLESNFGAMLIRNGMPIGYGVGCMLFDRVEIAINIFPSFRGGESAFIIEKFFHLFYHHFKARLFLVRSYQVGDDNEEALLSGSFWFYYKLGFRPVDNAVRKLARAESEKIKSRKNYRTSISTLKRLGKSDMFFHIDPGRMTGFKELPLKNLGYIVTRYIADKYNGERRKAIETSITHLTGVLPLKNWQRWSEDEKTALRRLAPLIVSIPNLNRWSARDKAGVAEIIRAKGKPRQKGYVLLCNKHKRFREALEALAFNWKRPDFD